MTRAFLPILMVCTLTQAGCGRGTQASETTLVEGHLHGRWIVVDTTHGSGEPVRPGTGTTWTFEPDGSFATEGAEPRTGRYELRGQTLVLTLSGTGGGALTYRVLEAQPESLAVQSSLELAGSRLTTTVRLRR